MIVERNVEIFFILLFFRFFSQIMVGMNKGAATKLINLIGHLKS